MKKKILLKLPQNKLDQIRLIPFVSALIKEFSDWERNFLINEMEVNYYEQLFSDEKFFVIPNDKNTLLGLHHFAVNLVDVFNIDLFVTLEASYKSDLIGYYFRSKERIGLNQFGRSVFYTHKVPKESICQNEKLPYIVLGNYLGKILSSPRRIDVDSIPKWFSLNPFILTLLSEDLSFALNELFKDDFIVHLVSDEDSLNYQTKDSVHDETFSLENLSLNDLVLGHDSNSTSEQASEEDPVKHELEDTFKETKTSPSNRSRVIANYPKDRLAEYILQSKIFFTDSVEIALFASVLSVRAFLISSNESYKEYFEKFPSPIVITPWTDFQGPDGAVPIEFGEKLKKLILASL